VARRRLGGATLAALALVAVAVLMGLLARGGDGPTPPGTPSESAAPTAALQVRSP
jgi:hypothetical protein